MTDQALIDQLKQEHGTIYVLTAADQAQEVMVRMPTVAEFDRYAQFIADKAKQTSAAKRLVEGCVVHPKPEEYRAMVQARPGLPLALSRQLLKICGANIDVEETFDEARGGYVLTADQGEEVVLRMPTVPEFDRYQSQLDDLTKFAKASKQLLIDCRVAPTEGEYKAMLEARPGLFVGFSEPFARICGLSAEVEAKKA